MDLRFRLVMAGLILVVVVVGVGGLVAPVHAEVDFQPAYDGHVFGCDDEPLEGAAVLINNTNENFRVTLYTNESGYYFTDVNKTYPMRGDLVILTATYGELTITKEVIVSESGPLTVDFTLCRKFPVDILALLGVSVALVLIVVLLWWRRKL